MTTITVWLLISLNTGSYPQRPITLVERFATAAECQRVAGVIKSATGFPITTCIQAEVIKP